MDFSVFAGIEPAFDNRTAIVICSSNLFAPYAGGLLQSIINHSSKENNYDIIIFEDEISEENKRILKLFERTNVWVRFFNGLECFGENFMADFGQRFPINSGYIITSFYRILAPYILEKYKRVIALDADMLVMKDIAELYDIDLGTACIGGVLDISWQWLYETNYMWKDGVAIRDFARDVLQMKAPQMYINGGMVIIDCKQYCAEYDMETICVAAQKEEYKFPEQDVWNSLFEGKIKFLDMGWNVMLPLNSRIKSQMDAAPEETRKAYEKAKADPYILHWAAKPKPWVCPDVPFGNEWWQTAMQTPFVGHIIARMIDELEIRREHYVERYGKKVAVWEPTPGNVDRKIGKA